MRLIISKCKKNFRKIVQIFSYSGCALRLSSFHSSFLAHHTPATIRFLLSVETSPISASGAKRFSLDFSFILFLNPSLFLSFRLKENFLSSLYLPGKLQGPSGRRSDHHSLIRVTNNKTNYYAKNLHRKRNSSSLCACIY